MKRYCNAVHQKWSRIAWLLDRLGVVVDLGVRLYVARVFFLSGLTKIQDWGTTIALFTDEYHVPVLPPHIAAVLGTSGELGFSVMLTLGLFTRFAAGGLFFVNAMAVISYFYVLKDMPAALDSHFYWGLLLILILVNKTGVLTTDNLVLRRWFPAVPTPA